MEILLATGNRHKRDEMRELMPPFQILLPAEAGVQFEYEETGTTFFENSLGKADTLYQQTGMPALADDSGLTVPALKGDPGVYSARYGTKPGEERLSPEERNAYLLKKMEGIEEREAFFVCCLTLVAGPYRIYTVQETLEGEITTAPRGGGGFGYDPLFFIPRRKKTVAELSLTEKNAISHRGRAVKKMKRLLDSLAEEEYFENLKRRR